MTAIRSFVLMLLAVAAGCGGSTGSAPPVINQAPITEAEKAAIRTEDEQVHAEESAPITSRGAAP